MIVDRATRLGEFIMIVDRATRLGEFSATIGWLYVRSWQFLKITGVGHIFLGGISFYFCKSYALILTKTGVLQFAQLAHKIIRGRFFVHFFPGKMFPPKNVGKKWNFPRKKFWKIVFPRNSLEFSAESNFPQRKMYEKSAPGHHDSWLIRIHDGAPRYVLAVLFYYFLYTPRHPFKDVEVKIFS
jgi:hypothetical protein